MINWLYGMNLGDPGGRTGQQYGEVQRRHDSATARVLLAARHRLVAHARALPFLASKNV